MIIERTQGKQDQQNEDYKYLNILETLSNFSQTKIHITNHVLSFKKN